MDQDDGCIYLPPGFRFHPMDEEIITHYLWEKVMDSSFNARAIGEVDLNKSEPWDLPSKAKMGEKEWYFFCQRDRKYPTGMRTNRATEAGYWKATGKDKEIYKGNGNLVGMKKTLVFYMGRAPKGEKTNWVMHEYRLEGKSSYHNIPRISKDEWVVCRVFHKNIETKRSSDEAFGRTNSFSVNAFLADELLDSPTLPPLVDAHRLTTSNQGQAMNFLPNFNFNHHVSMNPIATMAASSSFYSQTPPQTSFAPNYMGMGNMDYYLHQERSRLKEEEYSHQSLQVSASQDTGMSIDGNAEISSLKQDMAGKPYYDDLENLWKC